MKITQQTKTVWKMGEQEYDSLRELQFAALVNVGFLDVGVNSMILDHADQIIEILSLGNEPPPLKEYSDDDYKRFAVGSGIPVEILRRRVQSGKTLDQALAKPYKERTRKPKAVVPTPPSDPPTFGSGAE